MYAEEEKSPATQKPIYAELNQMAEILNETMGRIEGLEKIVNRIAQPEPSVLNKAEKEPDKQLSWDALTLEQKVKLLRQAAHNNYERLISVGNRLNGLV
jgi:hypothetical protein